MMGRFSIQTFLLSSVNCVISIELMVVRFMLAVLVKLDQICPVKCQCCVAHSSSISAVFLYHLDSPDDARTLCAVCR